MSVVVIVVEITLLYILLSLIPCWTMWYFHHAAWCALKTRPGTRSSISFSSGLTTSHRIRQSFDCSCDVRNLILVAVLKHSCVKVSDVDGHVLYNWLSLSL